ncbi:hypothetical protein V2G26_001756 [Clonostachys chloroleuca]
MASPKAKVLVVGSGGIGTIAALNLELGGQVEVPSVLRSNYEIVNTNGFTIRSCEHGEIQNWRPSKVLNTVPIMSDSAIDRQFDYIVCCTRNIPDVTPTVCDIIAPAVTPSHTSIVLIQNGLNIEKSLFHRFPSNIVISGVSRIDAHEIAPGIIEQKQNDLLHIGPFQNPNLSDEEQRLAAQRFVAIYSAGGRTTCLYKPDTGFDRWSKLVYNASWNPICAITGLDTGELQKMGRAMDTLVIPAMKEVLEVAQAAGHQLPEDIVYKTIQSNPVEENIVPSMQIDLKKGNFIEHENILGEIVREARNGRGVATPVLTVLYEITTVLQWRTQRRRGT